MRVIFFSVAIVLLDQISKLIVKGFTISSLNLHYNGMDLGQRISVIGDFFRITFVENPGMAFGYDPGLNLKLYISIFSLLASIGLFIYLYTARKQSLSLRIALAFILGGAVGNMIDRIFYGAIFDYAPLFYGSVVDFLDFDFFDITILGRSYDRFPIFNIADAAVSIGVLILLIFYKSHHKETEEIFTGVPKDNINEETPGTDIKKDDDGETGNGKEISI